jgi:hypothetical protein
MDTEPVAFLSRSRRASVALQCRGRDIAVAVPWRSREASLSEMSRVIEKGIAVRKMGSGAAADGPSRAAARIPSAASAASGEPDRT